MVHCIFLFPRNVPNRFIPASVAIAFTGFQLLFISGYLIPPFAAYLFSITIVGWLLQRTAGLCLSLGGETVYQKPLSVGVYVALPALLVLLGLVPACMTLAFFPGGNLNLALLTVNHAIGMLVLCAAPLSLLYLLLWLVHLRLETKLALSFAVFIVLAVLLGLTSILQRVDLYFAIVLFLAAFAGGVLTIYRCFCICGFRVVWAKRLVLSNAYQVVGFDDLD